MLSGAIFWFMPTNPTVKAGRLSTFRLELLATDGTSCGASRLAPSSSPDWSACRRAVESEIGRKISVFSFALVPQ